MFSPSITNWQRQRGAIGLWGSLTLMLAVLFMSLAVDSGRLWMQQRKLQSIADIASMEAAREIGCSTNTGDVVLAAQEAAVRNGYNGELGQAPNLVELGSVSMLGGVRQFSISSGQEAVRVYATQSVPASLVAGGLFGAQVVLNAEAVSSADPSLVSFAAGTFLLNVDTEGATLMNELLGELLGTSLNLSVLHYEGLAVANLTLANLVRAQGSVSSVEQLLEAEMSLADLLNLIAGGVEDAGTANGSATTALEELSSGIVNNPTIRLSDILSVSSPNEDATAELDLNAFSLITAAALFANEGSTVNMSLAGINAEITVTQAPLLAVGPSEGDNCTVARTAQLEIGVTASVAGVLSVSLNAIAAFGTAELTEYSDDGSSSHVAIEATPGIASVSGEATIAGVLIGINLPIGAAAAQEVEFVVDHPTDDDLPQTMTVASPLGDSLENALQQDDVLTIPLLDPITEALVTSIINATLSPLLGEIGRILLDPLLEMLGIRLGGMDVILLDIQKRQAKPLII